MDECRHCTLRGNLNECLDAECNLHKSWVFQEFVKTLITVIEMVEKRHTQEEKDGE